MINIVLTAQNFAFGPIGKLLYVTEILKERGYRLTFVGYGTSLQLARKFPFDSIFEIDTDDPKNIKQLESIISHSDVLISSMDIPSIDIAKKLKKPVVWLDCLFWFWDKIPPSTYDVDLYLSERFLDSSVNDKKFRSKISNFVVVGPIMGKIEKGKIKNQVIISFGGGQATHFYQAGRETNYPFLMTSILLENVDWSSFNRVIFTTSESIVLELKKRFPDATFEFTTLAHNEFLKEVAESKLLLTTPGLITAEAAFFSGTPTLFIPASNDSQYLQLEELRIRGLAEASVGQMDYMPHLELKHIPGIESTRLMLEQLRELEKLPNIQKEIGIKINELIKNQDAWSQKSIENGKNYINAFGGNGAESAANEISKLIASKNFNGPKS